MINTIKNASFSKKIQLDLNQTKRLFVEITVEAAILVAEDLFVYVDVTRRT